MGGVEVDVDQAGEILGLDLGEGPAVALADIVDQDVDRSGAGHLDRIAARSAMSKTSASAARPAARSSPSRGASRSARAAVQQHPGAGLGQALGHLPAQAAARAGDQGGAAIEPEVVGKGRHGAGHSSIAAARVSVVLANAATAESHRSSRGRRLCAGKHAGLVPRGPAARRHLGRDRRQADRRRRAHRDARRLAEADHGHRPAGGRDAARRAAAPRCRPSRRRSPASASWGWAATSRSSPARAARPRPRASRSRPCGAAGRRHLPPPLLSSFKDASLAAARAAAPEFARALLIGELEDDWRARAEAVGGGGHQHRRQAADRRRGRRDPARRATRSASTRSTTATSARALVGMGVRLRHHRRARRDPGGARLTDARI